jgi:hypothetical protein
MLNRSSGHVLGVFQCQIQHWYVIYDFPLRNIGWPLFYLRPALCSQVELSFTGTHPRATSRASIWSSSISCFYTSVVCLPEAWYPFPLHRSRQWEIDNHILCSRDTLSGIIRFLQHDLCITLPVRHAGTLTGRLNVASQNVEECQGAIEPVGYISLGCPVQFPFDLHSWRRRKQWRSHEPTVGSTMRGMEANAGDAALLILH